MEPLAKEGRALELFPELAEEPERYHPPPRYYRVFLDAPDEWELDLAIETLERRGYTRTWNVEPGREEYAVWGQRVVWREAP